MECRYCGSGAHTERICALKFSQRLGQFCGIGRNATVEEARELYEVARGVFRNTLRSCNYDDRKITALLTKFNDAGPRSAPTAAFSSVLPGRPQSGADGNRINRWLLPQDHKQFASEAEGRLIGTRFILQALSMQNAPEIPGNDYGDGFRWLLGHRLAPGEYLDPVMKEPIDFVELLNEPTLVTSGHFIPLSRDDGRHIVENTFLQLKKSNYLQGDNTLDELLEMMQRILARHSRE